MGLRRKEQALEKRRLDDQRELAYYGFKMNLYAQLALEIDKSLLTLSTAAIGLLVTLVAKEHSPLQESLAFTAFGFFTATVISALLSLHQSKKLIIESQTTENQKALPTTSCFPISRKQVVDTADFLAIWAFAAGVLSTIFAIIF